MKGIVEFKGCGMRVAYDARRGEFTQAAQVHPFVARPMRALVDADANRSPAAETFVSLAFARGPDARASLPVGPCLPRPAKRHVEARVGRHIRVRYRLPATEGQMSETAIGE